MDPQHRGKRQGLEQQVEPVERAGESIEKQLGWESTTTSAASRTAGNDGLRGRERLKEAEQPQPAPGQGNTGHQLLEDVGRGSRLLGYLRCCIGINRDKVVCRRGVEEEEGGEG